MRLGKTCWLLALSSTAILAPARAELILDQSYAGPATTGANCGTAGGSLFQSFAPHRSPLTAVDLVFNTTLADLSHGTDIHIRVREGSVTGPIVADRVNRFWVSNWQMPARFVFRKPVELSWWRTYYLEWVQGPGPSQNIFWLFKHKGTYPGGTAYGCLGFPAPEDDHLFATWSGS